VAIALHKTQPGRRTARISAGALLHSSSLVIKCRLSVALTSLMFFSKSIILDVIVQGLSGIFFDGHCPEAIKQHMPSLLY
jgi:hypothetical protein